MLLCVPQLVANFVSLILNDGRPAYGGFLRAPFDSKQLPAAVGDDGRSGEIERKH